MTYRGLGMIGRLGNALFEVAATIGIANTYNYDVRFPPEWMHRPFFSLPPEFYDWLPPFEATQPMEFATHIDPRCRQYLQDVNLFLDVLPQLRRYLSPSPLALETINGPECAGFAALPQPVLSMHVRRGDNVVDPGVPQKWRYMICPPLSYYQQALDMIGPGYASVACFSDDPAWCSRMLGQHVDYVHYGTTHPKENTLGFLTTIPHDWPELFLMARSQGHIISGSTYGIWGALLADSAEVIHSWPVYGDALPYIDASLLFLPEWKQLEHHLEIPTC